MSKYIYERLKRDGNWIPTLNFGITEWSFQPVRRQTQYKIYENGSWRKGNKKESLGGTKWKKKWLLDGLCDGEPIRQLGSPNGNIKYTGTGMSGGFYNVAAEPVVITVYINRYINNNVDLQSGGGRRGKN